MPKSPSRPENTPNLWASLTRPALLDQAWQRVRSNGGCSGGDGVTINAYAPRASQRLAGLSAKLIQGRYQPRPVRKVDIPKKSGGVRTLLIPSLEDRIVHTSAAMVLNPVLDPQFENSSFAYRPGRSVKQAVQAIDRWRKEGFWHVIEADIVGFFDAIRHDQLLIKLEVALAGLPGGDDIVDMIEHWLSHLSQETGVPGKGVSQGSPMSPLLANLYLDALDEALDQKGLRLVRFADDFVVLAKKRATAEAALAETVEILSSHGLSLHKDGTRVVDFGKGFEFLGHLFVRSLVMQQVSDPEEDIIAVLRDVSRQDDASVKEAEALKAEAEGGYDRGARVLYVTEPGRKISLRNMSYSVNQGDRELVAIANERVSRIEIGPGVLLHPSVIPLALGTATDLVFLSSDGSVDGRLERPSVDRGALQLAQAETVLDPVRRVVLCRELVEARIRNQRTQLFRLNRRQNISDVTEALARMGRHLRKLKHAEDVAVLRGLEGAVAAEYWPALGLLCDRAPAPFRRTRPGTDPLNVTINYLTAMLERDVRAALQSAGLHTSFGLLHQAQDYHDAAIYDLMEPFRAPLNEGVAVFLFNARRLTKDMFETREKGMRITTPGRKAIIAGYESAIGRQVTVPGRKMKLAWRPLMCRQAVALGKAFLDPSLTFQAYRMEA